MTEAEIPPTETKSNLTRIIFKNTLFVTLQGIFIKVINFLFSIYVIRELGDERFGQYATVLAFVGIFQILAELGLSQFIMREISRDRKLARTYFWNLIALRLILSILGIIAITWAAFLIGYSAELVIGVFVYTLGFILSSFLVPTQVVLAANERLDFLSGAVLVGQIVQPVLGTLFLLNGMSYIMLIIASLISILPQIGLGIWGIRHFKLGPLPFHIDTSTWISLLRNSLPFGIISLALTIDFSIDTFLLSLWAPDSVVGWYNVAYGLVRSILSLFSGFMVAIVPSLTRTFVDDKDTVEKWYFRSTKYSLFVSIPIAIGGMLLAFDIINFLYTNEYAPASLALRIIIWDMPFLMIAGLGGQITTIISEERAAARVYIISAIVNVLLNLIFIPRFSYLGASVVTVLTDSVVALQFYLLLNKRLNIPKITPILGRILFAAATMGVLVWFSRELNLLFVIAIGIVAYIGMAFLGGIFDQTELDILRKAINKLRRQPSSSL